MNLGQLSTLPTTLDGRQVAEAFGCSYWALLDQVKAGTCPVPPLRLGRKLRWPTAAVLRALGVGPGDIVMATVPMATVPEGVPSSDKTRGTTPGSSPTTIRHPLEEFGIGDDSTA